MSHKSARRRFGAAGPRSVIAAAMAAALPAAAQSPASSEKPDEIIVTSSVLPTPRRQIATAVSVIDGAEMELRGYDSLVDVLRTQPGIGVTNTGGPGKTSALRIRGEEGYRTLLVIDGMKSTDPSSTQAQPVFDNLLATNDFERVEILRGPQGFKYGADAGGVVNVVTGRGDGPFGGRFALEQGTFDTRKVEGRLSGGNDAGDFYVSATDLSSDGFSSQTSDLVLGDDDGTENTTLHTKLGWNASDKVRLQLVGRSTDATTQYDGCFYLPTFSTEYDCVATLDQTSYRLSADVTGARTTHSFGYSGVDTARDNLSLGESQFASDGKASRFEYTGSFAATEAHSLAYGVDLQREEVAGLETLKRDQDGYYVEYQGKFDDRFFLSAGARYDDNDDFGTHVSQRVGVAYVQNVGGGMLKYRATYGTGFRAPSLYEISYNRDPFSAFPPARGLALAEEESEGFDVGVDFDTANPQHFEATYFDQEITDEIFFDLATFSGYLQSAGTSKSTGVELGLTAPIGERWQFLANWTNNDAENTTSQQRLRRPKNLANFGVTYASASEAFRFSANYRLARDAVDQVGATRIPLDDYEVLDASVSYAVNDTLELYARAQNLTDEEYIEVIGYNTAGREGYVGVRLRF
jgi:vitamin B12 transporter